MNRLSKAGIAIRAVMVVGTSAGWAATTKVTFTEDVALIFYQACVAAPCIYPSGARAKM